MLKGVVGACMTNDQTKRPDILELCQMMIPVLMAQLDELRERENKSESELSFLKEKIKAFEGTNAGFYRRHAQFSSTAQTGQEMETGGFPRLNKNISEPKQGSVDLKIVNVNSDNLKKMSADPVSQFLETVNKLSFVVNLPPSLDKDQSQVNIENF